MKRFLLSIAFLCLIATGANSFWQSRDSNYNIASGAAWTPAQLPGLVAWYKADVGVFTDTGCTTPAANTNTVACWADQSGHGYNAVQATTNHRPTYLTAGLNSKPTLNFSSALISALLTTTGVAMGTGTSGSIYGIGTLTSTSIAFANFASYSPPTGAGNGTGFMGYFESNTASSMIGQKGATNATAFAISLSTETRWGAIADGVNITNYVNGTGNTPVAASVAFVSGGCIAIGDAVGTTCTDGGTTHWNGVMSEIVITNQAISAPNLALLDAYLAARW